ncbi:MAG: creatininase family protein [Wenzhouxiangella sp.]|nr:MAG: creatininase family protein [Wenzhouxiangella sp.]
MISCWQHLTSPELAELAGADALAVMALGAIEQHGPHLPLSTDLDIATGLQTAALARLDGGLNVVVLPPMALGASQEHAGFAGTLSLPPEQMSAQLISLGAGLARAGLRRLVLINAHGGNIGWLGPAALELRARHGMLVVKANYMLMRAPDHLLAADELRHGLHGGQAETAMMLHLHPERVRSDRLECFPSCAEMLPDSAVLGPEGEAAWAWLAEDLNPQGVVGDARGASAEIGRELVDYYAARLARVLTEAAQMDISGFESRSPTS